MRAQPALPCQGKIRDCPSNNSSSDVPQSQKLEALIWMRFLACLLTPKFSINTFRKEYLKEGLVGYVAFVRQDL